jgi:hypothetical protein
MIYHKHHIIPKHMGGSDDPSNLIKLTIEEHAEAHRILYEQYGKIEDRLAWHGLLGLIGKDDILLEIAKSNGEKISNAKKGKTIPWNRGIKTGALSEAHRLKISKGGIGKKKPGSGARKGQIKSSAHRDSLRLAVQGKKRYNNGKVNRMFIPGNQPEDFTKGWV